MEFAGLSLSDLLSLFAVVLDEEEEEEEDEEAFLDLSLELLGLSLDLVYALDFLMAVELVVGGWVRIVGVRV